MGSSPLKVNGEVTNKCYLIGGYGRIPARESDLSEESLKLRQLHGECITFAMIPRYDVDGDCVVYELVKIFSPPVLHEREKTDYQMDMIYPKNHN